jgi:hypothetical protein
VILAMLADGRLHLTAIAMLAPHLTPENRDLLLERAAHKTKREVEELLARLAPRPDAPTVIRKLPERRAERFCMRLANELFPDGTSAATSPFQAATALATSAASPSPADDGASATIPPTKSVPATDTSTVSPCAVQHASDSVVPVELELRLDGVVSGRLNGTVTRPWRVEPFSPARYKVQFTASAELREKLERLQDLMRSSVLDGDLAKVIDVAVTERLVRLERRRFGRTKAHRVAAPVAAKTNEPKAPPSPA